MPKFLHFFLVTFIVISSFHVNAQCDTLRYKTPIFDSITEHQDVKYGTAPKWSIPYNDKDLHMDIYTPYNDTLAKRPLMIWAHSGGFLNGNKNADDMVALCDSFARRGYVTATIEYRKGFNPTSETSAERAVYRAVQDMRSAIRFLKEHATDYGIDTNYTFVGGTSAGAFIALQVVYMDQDEAPASIAAGLGFPALGSLDSEGNEYTHNMDITGYTNMWGAVGDSSWVQADEKVPGLLIHGTTDGTVPFGVGHPFGLPTTPITNGSRCISNQLSALDISHSTYFVPGQGHGFHGGENGEWDSSNPPTPYYDTIFNLISKHYSGLLKRDTFSINGDETVCAKDTITYKVNAPNNYQLCWKVNNGTLIHSAGDSAQVIFENSGQAELFVKQFSEIDAYNGITSLNVNINALPTVNFINDINGSFVTFGPLPDNFVNYNWTFGDGNTSGIKSPTHEYSSPGTYTVSLTVKDTNGCRVTQKKEVDLTTLDLNLNKTNELKVYPNPTKNTITIYSEQQLSKIILYSMQGKTLKSIDVKSIHPQIDLSDLTSGTYFLKIISTNKETQTKKVHIRK